MKNTPERHARLRTAFDEALSLDPFARQHYVDHVCTVHADLRPDLVRLLAAHGHVETFLECPAWRFLGAEARSDDFRGTARFAVRRTLGAGGMGVVYEVQDTVRNEVVALKTLKRTRAEDVFRLKREFRSLADLVHRNLVCLYELIVDDEQCVFTMELIDGVPLVEYIRRACGANDFDTRLRSAFAQLVDGVTALHRAGKLHRDIKPSNVLVTPEGRVVILDFGLLVDREPWSAVDDDDAWWGTPAYMAPETGVRGAATEAADWYAVGVTLFEAVTGQLPFTGPSLDLLQRKRTIDPPRPVGVAPDVGDVCLGLLHRDPGQRINGQEALRRLGLDLPSTLTLDVTFDRRSRFVGREHELGALDASFRDTARGKSRAVYVSGPSGSGKSALLRQFLRHVQARHDCVVLAGRCYENEAVPYKALDAIVDALGRHLDSRAHWEIERLLPHDVMPLSRLFPVLGRVGAIAAAIDRDAAAVVEPQVLRHRGFAALRGLLSSMAAQQPLVIAIDDLQWTDADSVALLDMLLRPPNAPAVLMVVCFRSEEADNPLLQRLVGAASQLAWSPVRLEPMAEGDARALIDALASDEPLPADRVHQIATEANGSPFLIEQLTRYFAVTADTARAGASVADMLAARLAGLPAAAKALLETLSVCGRPLAADVVGEAAGSAGDTRQLVALLRAAHIVRSSGSSERIEAYHDRLREVVVAQLQDDEVRSIHGRLAQALVARKVDDPEVLFEHYVGAGERELAAPCAAGAAGKALAALAFDRAAWFFERALTLAPGDSARATWKVGLAEALANAGRPAESARAFLEAADVIEPSHRVELQRRAAEQFLIGGHIDQGIDVIRTVLRAADLPALDTPRASLVRLLWHRARLGLRGLAFVEQDAACVHAEDSLRIDTCWSVATGLGMVDTVRAAPFSALHVRLALDAGDPYRIARAFATEATFRASLGHAHRHEAAALITRAKTLAERIGHPHARAVCAVTEGLSAILGGRWQDAHESSQHALRLLRDGCVGVTWERNTAHSIFLWSLMYLGRLRDLSEKLPALLAQSLDTGNLALAAELRTRMNMFWLASDDPDEGLRQVRETFAGWSQAGFHRQHYSALLAEVQTALYRGDGAAAWRLISTHWTQLRQTQQFRAQVIRVEAWFLRGRSALALAGVGQLNRALVDIARSDARRIAAEDAPWSNPIGLLLNAGVAWQEGRATRAADHLASAITGFDAAGMALYAAVARRRLAVLQEGSDRRETERRAGEWMLAQGIKDPLRLTRAFASGFGDG